MALEKQIEDQFIRYLSENLKYVYRPDINDRDSLERNFREKFQTLNRCHLLKLLRTKEPPYKLFVANELYVTDEIEFISVLAE